VQRANANAFFNVDCEMLMIKNQMAKSINKVPKLISLEPNYKDGS